MSWVSQGIEATGDFLFGEDVEKPEMPQTPEAMNYQFAMKQARNALNPGYQQQLDETLGKINTQNVQRGFYGQATGDQIKQNAAANLAAQHNANVAKQALNVRRSDWNRKMGKYKAKMNKYRQNMKEYQQESQGLLENPQFWSTVGSITGAFLGGPAGATIGSKLFGGASEMATEDVKIPDTSYRTNSYNSV